MIKLHSPRQMTLVVNVLIAIPTIKSVFFPLKTSKNAGPGYDLVGLKTELSFDRQRL